MGCIYKLTFKSGKSYIGQSMRALNIRINAHRTAAARGSMLPVHCAWRAHGEPSIEVVCEVDTQDDLHDAEIALIASLGTLSPSGYNVSRGGDTAPSKNPEVAAKISAKAIGRKWSEEKKQQFSDALRIRWKDEEYQAKVSAGLRDSFATPEAKEKLSKRSLKAWQERKESGWTMPESTKDKLRSKVVSAETRERMSASAKDRGMPASVGEKGAAALRGKVIGPYSAERKAATGAGVKAAWQDPVKRANLTAARKQAWATRRLKSEGSTGSVSVSLADPLFSEGAA